MAPRPVIIRLLDPPIHEFLPSENELVDGITQLTHLRETLSGLGVLSETIELIYRNRTEHPAVNPPADPRLVDEAIARKEAILKKVRELHEVNPMLGHRGVRLGLTFPEIYAMQIRAILEAAAACSKSGLKVHPEIMVPQVAATEELERVRRAAEAIAKSVEGETGIKVPYRFGSMLEVVRACLLAEKLAGHAEFFSFGTNDLTQAVFSFSREDAENKFLPMYNANEILHDNPFEVLDAAGVGKLMDIAVRQARAARPGVEIGICGEHGGHPASIRFCHSIGLDYVSCSPPRVPLARLAAAHAALLLPREVERGV
jgi:pyruvate, orthophosphate dikinase